MDYNEGYVDALNLVEDVLGLSEEQKKFIAEKLDKELADSWIDSMEENMEEESVEEDVEDNTEDEREDAMEQKLEEGKSVQILDDFIIMRDYLVRWGSEFKKDVEGLFTNRTNPDGSIGEYFTPDTDFSSEQVSKGFLPIDWFHRRDTDADMPRDDILGYVDLKSAVVTDEGLIVSKILNRRHRFVKAIQKLIEAGLIHSSSEPYQELVSKASDGRITRWGLFRDSLTISPMEHRLMPEFKSSMDEETKMVLLEYGIITDEGDEVIQAKSTEDMANNLIPETRSAILSLIDLDNTIENL
jgi:hypothetical protein